MRYIFYNICISSSKTLCQAKLKRSYLYYSLSYITVTYILSSHPQEDMGMTSPQTWTSWRKVCPLWPKVSWPQGWHPFVQLLSLLLGLCIMRWVNFWPWYLSPVAHVSFSSLCIFIPSTIFNDIASMYKENYIHRCCQSWREPLEARKGQASWESILKGPSSAQRRRAPIPLSSSWRLRWAGQGKMMWTRSSTWQGMLGWRQNVGGIDKVVMLRFHV